MNTLQLVFRIIPALICLVADYFWFFRKPTGGCPLGNSDAYCDVHPLFIGDIIGLVLFHLSVFVLVTGWPLSKLDTTRTGYWPWFAVLILGGAGFIFIAS